MHVESVAWADERKNLLFAAFFLGSLLAYTGFIDSKKGKFYILALFLFLLALFSKAAAVTLAPTLLLFDYFWQRKLLSKKVLIEKAPFFLLAILFGIIAVLAQKDTWGEDLSQEYYTFPERVLYASKAFVFYIVKLIIPFKLSAFYSYREHTYLLEILTVLLSLFSLYIIYRFRKKNPFITFGLLFFIVNIFILLKLFEVPAGDYFMADRYVYIPSLGVFLLAGIGVEKLIRNPKSGRYFKIVLAVYLLFIGLQTFNRVMVWEDDETFYSDIIRKYPDEPVAYTNRGGFRKMTGNREGALKDFNKAIQYRPDDYKGYANRGAVQLDLGKFDKAKDDYAKANELKAGNAEIIAKLGFAKLNTKDPMGAVSELDRAIILNPTVAEYYSNRGTAKFNLKRLNEAVIDYSDAIELDNKYITAWFNRGLVYLNMNKTEEAISDFGKVIELDPRHVKAYMNRGVAWSRSGSLKRAIEDYNKAIQLNPNYLEAYLNRGIDRCQAGDYKGALEDLNLAISGNPGIPVAFYFRGLAKIELGKKSEACEDLKTALSMGFRSAREKLTGLCQ
ncbi:MAG: tetratricopeptide repeat protein [Bacteroidales bacterium]|nr:tetratricopeptide repeat protein [Bacteroidales bacterium]